MKKYLDIPNSQYLPLIDRLRAIKKPKEVFNIKKGAEILDLALSDFKKYLEPGLSEAELALWLEKRCAKYGARALAFPVIVASGPGTAEVHHWPGKRRVRQGDFLMVDFGVVINGYCSDMTRTLIIGQPTKQQIRVYRAVLNAQLVAIKKVRSDVTGGQLDSAARSVLRKARLNSKFIHNLGHGVGMNIHEWPRLGRKSKDVLKKNMIVTVEPGVYIKSWGGVRIEDMVRVTNNGCEVLAKSPKSLEENTIKVDG